MTKPTNDLRELVSRMIIENRNETGAIDGMEQRQLLEDILALLARRQNELIEESLEHIAKLQATELYSQTLISLDEVTALLKRHY